MGSSTSINLGEGQRHAYRRKPPPCCPKVGHHLGSRRLAVYPLGIAANTYSGKRYLAFARGRCWLKIANNHNEICIQE